MERNCLGGEKIGPALIIPKSVQSVSRLESIIRSIDKN